MKKYEVLPNSDHVMRYVSPTRIRRDEDHSPVGINYVALQLKSGEDGLSVTHCEYFHEEYSISKPLAVKAQRESNLVVKENAAFATFNVGDIHFVTKEKDYKVKVLFLPTDSNDAHAEIRTIPLDDIEILEDLAANYVAISS